jgi:hypothetical protein
MRLADDQPPTSRRLTVQDAAGALGITVDAVRGRIKRGSLESTKDEDGTIYVLLDERDQADGQSHLAADQSGLVEGLRGQISTLEDQVSFLRSELLTRNEELRRKDHIIAALTERIPELEAPREASESRESAATESEGEAPPDGEQRSWWRRVFG